MPLMVTPSLCGEARPRAIPGSRSQEKIFQDIATTSAATSDAMDGGTMNRKEAMKPSLLWQ